MGSKSSKEQKQTQDIGVEVKERVLEERPKDALDEEVPISQKEIELDPPVPISARKCTDCFFCLVFLCYLVGMLTIGIVGFLNGDPQRLVYGTDYKGRTCGVGNKTNETFLIYPRPQEDVVLAGAEVATSEPWRISFFSICTESCPTEGTVVCDDEGKDLVHEAVLARPSSDFQTEAKTCLSGFVAPFNCYDSDIRKHCWPTLFDTTSVLFRCFPTYVFDIEILESGCIEQNMQYNSLTGQNVTTCVKYKEVTKRTTIEPTASDILFDSFNTITQTFQRNVADVVKCWPVVITSGVVVSVAVGFIYILSLWLFVRLVVWGSVCGVQIMAIFFTVYLYIKAGIITLALVNQTSTMVTGQVLEFGQQASTATGLNLINATLLNGNFTPILITNGSALSQQFSASKDYTTEFTNAAYFMTAISFMLFILILLLRKRIARAIEIFQEASHAIKATPCLVFIPFCSVPIVIALVAYFTASTAYIASSGSYQVKQMNYSFPVNPSDGAFEVSQFGTFSYVEVFVAYNLVGFLWLTNFVTAIVVYIIAGTVGHWYWKGSEHAEGNGWGASPLLRAFYIVFRFHLGSCAMGALLVSIVQFIRYFAAYVESRSKTFSQRSRIMKSVICCVNCLLKCLEYCVKFISRNAYIIGALYGDSFCSSTKQAFVTITSNLAQVALVTFLGDIILRFGQMLVALIAAFSCWVYLDNHAEYNLGGNLQLNTFWFPTLLSFLLGWFVANECLSIYDITVDTLLISFCQDQKLKKHNAKERKQLKQSKSMATFIKKEKKKEIEELDEDHANRRREVAFSE